MPEARRHRRDRTRRFPRAHRPGPDARSQRRRQRPGAPLRRPHRPDPAAAAGRERDRLREHLRGREIPALVDYVDSTGYATTLVRGGMVAKTVEHLLATLHAYGITNLLVKMQAEVPILDGSASEFCDLLESGGIVRAGREGRGDRHRPHATRSAIPRRGKDIASSRRRTSRSTTRSSIRRRSAVSSTSTVHGGPETFRDEIAPARTFGFVKEIETLEQMGLASGGRLNNCILIGDDGVVNTRCASPTSSCATRFSTSWATSILLGRPIRGRIVARMTGHGDNIALLQQLHRGLAS